MENKIKILNTIISENIIVYSDDDKYFLTINRLSTDKKQEHIINRPAEFKVYRLDKNKSTGSVRLFTKTCGRHRTNFVPLFCTSSGKTYLLNYTDGGVFQLFDMNGVVISECKGSEIFPLDVVQIDENTLFMNAWMWHPVYFETKIFLDQSILTGKIKFEEEYEYSEDSNEGSLE
jgi:hypothetical protein